MIKINTIEDMKHYYVEETNTYVFNEDVSIGFDVDLKANIKGCDIIANDFSAYNIEALNIASIKLKAHNVKVIEDLHASDIEAFNIQARDILAQDIFAHNIKTHDIKSYEIKAKTIKANNIKATDIISYTIEANIIEASSVEARNLKAYNVYSHDITVDYITANKIDAHYIKTWKIEAKIVDAYNITYLAMCFSYKNMEFGVPTSKECVKKELDNQLGGKTMNNDIKETHRELLEDYLGNVLENISNTQRIITHHEHLDELNDKLESLSYELYDLLDNIIDNL